ncbi:ras-like protein [Anaeramoeba flamelloides]|uniref:Ras-like protein n=1 Tax=Anaeramoeba flamelloides TaxID=1746091 RepID=A0ABQ8Y5E1_9EUKA|nr:ras-like protein [Anaeramoeba flamelloides]
MSIVSTTTLVVCGSGSVGKSALTIQFLQNHFITSYDPTIEECYRRQIFVDEIIVFLNILDTAGQEEYSSMRQFYLSKGDGFLFVYSIVNPDSFQAVPQYFSELDRNKDGQKCAMLLIGNKKDLEKNRRVQRCEGEKLAKEYNCSFIETSAKTSENVEKAFFTLVREVRKLKEKNELLKKSKKRKRRKSCNVL